MAHWEGRLWGFTVNTQRKPNNLPVLQAGWPIIGGGLIKGEGGVVLRVHLAPRNVWVLLGPPLNSRELDDVAWVRGVLVSRFD